MTAGLKQEGWEEAGLGMEEGCGARVQVEGTANAKSLMWERTRVFNTLSNVARAYWVRDSVLWDKVVDRQEPDPVDLLNVMVMNYIFY